MIRIIFRWRVVPGQFERFTTAWAAVTDLIAADEGGSLGSQLLRDRDDPDIVVAVAGWRRLEDRERSRPLAETHPELAAEMLDSARLEEWHVYDLVDDRTLDTNA